MITLGGICVALILLVAILGLIFKFLSLALKIILVLGAIYLVYQLVFNRNKQ